MKPDDNFKVFDENAEVALKNIGDQLHAGTPEGYGFVFLMTSFGKGGNTFYVANVQRSDVIEMMKEFIASNEQTQ